MTTRNPTKGFVAPRRTLVRAFAGRVPNCKKGAPLSDRRKELTKQLVVRVDDELYSALEQDAAANGRTVAQSVRFKLRELATAR